ncbi:transporter substrate-binding domain-containing protein [Paracoccus aurantiacus]|uniref:Transporter substrate-binding domain-containing protein n=1 Tax=Paracoccus aurantiacus TaxID=2599412 RepID=A0A5C6S7W2_9RHOB|nr:transporter substrate-binding domain-containing protein [Paracoccus aurantiacus]TXB69832.1 transporter substrate-binding domain-containing protein [Paracoccus aurantiacus]
MDQPDLNREFAPTGVLRVALNHGNRVLVGRDEAGKPVGISVDIANALARRLGLPLEFVEFDRAVDVSASATQDRWDVCFLAVDPERARTIAFTAPYVRIEGCYLAGPDCEATDALQLVASDAAVGTVRGSAYTLTLQRQAGAENLVMFENIGAALSALDRHEVAAIAGIRQAMEAEAAHRPGSRVLQPPFMEIRQAMAVPQGRPAASRALSEFLNELMQTGALGDILETHGVGRGSAIMPEQTEGDTG